MKSPLPFQNIFLHRIGLMAIMADHIDGTPDATVEGYFQWSAEHLLAQRTRLLAQNEEMKKLRERIAELEGEIVEKDYETRNLEAIASL